MRAVIQRVRHASVTIDGLLQSSIGQGLLILLGVEPQDGSDDIEWLAKKIAQMRIFEDREGKMNLSIEQIGGEAMVVSQFTLFASTKNGNRPSFIGAAAPKVAIPLYEQFCRQMELLLNHPVKTGVFGADMKVELLNDGPVTILMDTKNRE